MGKKANLKIAMIGSKGIPANFGGIERHVEEISVKLASRGHRVTVFGRKSFSSAGDYRGVRSVIMPSFQTKNMDTATNSLFSTLKAMTEDFDILHYHGIGPSLFCPLAALSSRARVVTIHALDYRQVKWGWFASGMLRFGERTAVLCPEAAIAVSKLMKDELEVRYCRDIYYVPNGATLYSESESSPGEELGLERESYLLTVGRFIREKGFHTLLKAFKEIETDKKLVIVGDETASEDYTRELNELADERVVFAGYLTGSRLNKMYAGCYAYVLPSTVEGLPISLLEAMSFSRPVLISDIPENVEVAGDIALSFKKGDVDDLRSSLERILLMDRDELKDMGDESRRRVEDRYNWDTITDHLEEIYRSIT